MSTHSEIVETLINILEENHQEMIEIWIETIYGTEKKNDGEWFRGYGISLYKLIKKGLTHPQSDEELKSLAYKIGKERAEANESISDFIYYVISGRSVLYRFIYQKGISFNESYYPLDNISQKFDYFCYHAVAKYTEIKDKELQEKVLFIDQTHKDRLTLLGQMSSSFVHEFRNPLTAIMGFIKLLKAGPQNQMYLDIIDHELQQLNYRITQFLHTSKKELTEKDKEEVIIPLMLTDILNFLYPVVVDGECELTTKMESDLRIMAYGDELKQVIQNILLNSIDAVKEKKKPREIKIVCGLEDHQIVIRILNNGPMIPSKTIETIFEPFFTTKELGTGIGLYVCKKIIQKHNGNIVCDSNEEWTTFSIFLPLEVPASQKQMPILN